MRILNLLKLLFPIAFTATSCFAQATAAGQAPPPGSAIQSYGRLPLGFEANQGQAGSAVRFLARGPGYTLLLNSTEAVLSLGAGQLNDLPRTISAAESGSSFLRLQLAGADPNAVAIHEDPLVTRTNYFLGNDPKQWHADIPNYGRVRFAGVYPGIDLVYYGNQGRLEHDFVIAPNADPGRIRLRVIGDEPAAIDPATGDLILASAPNQLRLLKPTTYQNIAGKRQEVSSSYQLLPDGSVGFRPGSYDSHAELVIDPVLVYSTYFGGSGNGGYSAGNYAYTGDWISSIAVDSTDNAYLTGVTTSADFPVSSPFQSKLGSPYGNVFVSKLSADGSTLLYSTYLGGSGGYTTSSSSSYAPYLAGDSSSGIAVDSQGNAYVTGTTGSSDFPTEHPMQSSLKCVYNAFVAKLNASGSALDYSTYLGGSGNTVVSSGGFSQTTTNYCDSSSGIAVDSSGSAYVVGATGSSDFPLEHAYQSTLKSPTGNAFLSKLTPDGSALVYSTYLGGSKKNNVDYTAGLPIPFFTDQANGVAVDASGSAYVVGYTLSRDFPTANAYSASIKNYGGSGAFITKFSSDGGSLVYSTYLGGSTADSASGIAVDSGGHAFVTGTTASKDFPTVNAFQATFPTKAAYNTAFVSKFNAAGSALIYSTYLGGSGGDQGSAIAIDNAGSAYVTGFTGSSDFPVTANALQPAPTSPYVVAFVAKLAPPGNAVQYATYLGGDGGNNDSGNGVAVDAQSDILVAGLTAGNNFPVSANALQPTNHNSLYYYGNQGFITKFSFPALSPSQVTLAASINPQIVTRPVTLTAQLGAVSQTTPPSGPISFYVDRNAAVSMQPDSSGHASITLSDLAVGNHQIVAGFAGSESFDASHAGLTLHILADSTGASAVAGANQTGRYGLQFSVPLVIYVTDAFNNPASGQTVSFSGSGLIFNPASGVTGADGKVQTLVTAISVGNLTALATASSVSKPVDVPLYAAKAQLTLQPVSISLRYGSPIPALTGFHVTGLVNGDTRTTALTGTPVLTTTATASSPVGTYRLSMALGTLSSTDYALALIPSNLQITKAYLTVTPANATIHVGDPLPAFTYALTGFVNGDTQASAVTGAPILATTAVSSAKPGHFPITARLGTLAAANYSFITATGTLTIEP